VSVTTEEALKTTRELLRGIANLMPEPSEFAETETQVEVLEILARTEFREPGDAELAVYGTVAALHSALGRLPDEAIREMERDQSSVFHDVGRWHAKVFRQPGFRDGVSRGRHVTAILGEALDIAATLREAIEALLAAEPDMEPRLRDVLTGWLRGLDAAASETRTQQQVATDDPTIFYAGQMVAEAAYALAQLAWSAVAIFGYSSVTRDPNAVESARERLLLSARAAGDFISSWVGSWKS
jgi:hypothetical protein